LGDSTLTTVSSHCDLGVVVSSNLSWTTHYNQILNKAYKSLGLLQRIFRASLSIHAKKLLYFSLVRSKVTYYSHIWHPYLLKDIIIFERLQRRATKFILNNNTDDYKQRLTNLNLLPLMYQFDYYNILIPSKILTSGSIFLIMYLSALGVLDQLFIISF